MDLLPKLLKKSSQKKALNFYLMFYVTQAVLQSAISNGWRIFSMWDGVDYSESGNKNQRKIYSMLSKMPLKVTHQDLV